LCKKKNKIKKKTLNENEKTMILLFVIDKSMYITWNYFFLCYSYNIIIYDSKVWGQKYFKKNDQDMYNVTIYFCFK